MFEGWLGYTLAVPGFELAGMELVGLGVVVLLVWLAFTRLFSRVGLSPAFALLMLVPGINVLALLALAYGSWPITRELSGLRRVHKAAVQAGERYLDRAA